MLRLFKSDALKLMGCVTQNSGSNTYNIQLGNQYQSDFKHVVLIYYAAVNGMLISFACQK